MRIDNNDIIRTARELRDEDNLKLHVRPWTRRRFSIPTWLAAVPAAAVAGFLLGIWTNGSQSDSLPLTALVDTVYVQVDDTASAIVTAQASKTMPSAPPVRRSASAKHRRRVPEPTTAGLSMADDRIRYDLLVKN